MDLGTLLICFVRRSAADKYDPAKDFSRYNQAWTIASGPDQFVINNETYDANELYIILTEGNRLRIGKPEKIGDSNYEVLTEGLLSFQITIISWNLFSAILLQDKTELTTDPN